MSKWAFFREIIIQAYIVILYSHYVFKTCNDKEYARIIMVSRTAVYKIMYTV